MSERFVVEADRKVVGLAVRVPGGYKFFSSDHAYFPLEGRTFPRAKMLANSVARITRRRGRDADAEAEPATPSSRSH